MAASGSNRGGIRRRAAARNTVSNYQAKTSPRVSLPCTFRQGERSCTIARNTSYLRSESSFTKYSDGNSALLSVEATCYFVSEVATMYQTVRGTRLRLRSPQLTISHSSRNLKDEVLLMYEGHYEGAQWISCALQYLSMTP